MATGIIGQSQIDDAVRTMVAEAVTYGEHKGIYRGTVTEKRLPRKQGRNWTEPALPPLSAFGANPDEEYDSPQQIQDSKVVITPLESIVQFEVSRRADITSTLNLMSMLGELASDGLEQKRDADGLLMYDTAGGVLGSPSTALSVDLIARGAAAIRSGRPIAGGTLRTGARVTGDRPKGQVYAVFHEYNRLDLQGQLSGLGGVPSQISTGNVPMNYAGQTLSDYNARWIQDGTLEGRIASANLLIDNNFTISANAIKGGIYAEDAWLHITFIDYDPFQMPTKDGRFTTVTVIADYGNGKRADNYAIETQVDASFPVP